MKWAVIGLVALVVLGGVGYAVYSLTDAPEQAQEWWDEKRLENFPTIAQREIDEMEGRLTKLKETRSKLDLERIKLQGGEKLGDSNFSTADSGFMTVYGYEKRIAAYVEAGEKLGKAFADAKAAPGAVIDASSGELDPNSEIAVSFTHPKSGKAVNQNITVGSVRKILEEEIETELSTMEYECELVKKSVENYVSTIGKVDETIKAQEVAIKEFKQEVKKIEAELKMIKVQEDLAEINKAISGEQSNSNLGKLISQYEKKKKDFAARQIQEEGSASGKTTSLDDLAKGSGSSSSKKSRFIK